MQTQVCSLLPFSLLVFLLFSSIYILLIPCLNFFYRISHFQRIKSVKRTKPNISTDVNPRCSWSLLHPPPPLRSSPLPPSCWRPSPPGWPPGSSLTSPSCCHPPPPPLPSLLHPVCWWALKNRDNNRKFMFSFLQDFSIVKPCKVEFLRCGCLSSSRAVSWQLQQEHFLTCSTWSSVRCFIFI